MCESGGSVCVGGGASTGMDWKSLQMEKRSTLFFKLLPSFFIYLFVLFLFTICFRLIIVIIVFIFIIVFIINHY